MKFKRTGPNSASSDDGFEVKIAKRNELHYVAGGNATIVPIEIMTDRVVVVSVSYVTSVDRELIRTHIADALDYLHIPHRFD